MLLGRNPFDFCLLDRPSSCVCQFSEGGPAEKAAATSCRLLLTHSLFLPCPHIHLLSVVVGGRFNDLSLAWGARRIGSPGGCTSCSQCRMDGFGSPSRRDWLCVNSDDFYWLYSKIIGGMVFKNFEWRRLGMNTPKIQSCILSGPRWKYNCELRFKTRRHL